MKNKNAVIQEFETEVKPFLNYRDQVAIGSAWCEYIDGLVKDGILTEKQVDRWGNPYS